jgi:enoyl-CoA hydratase/carnithine racemase
MIVTTDHETENGSIRELRLDRPPANALDPGLIAALGAAVRDAADSGAGALVISGRPGMLSGGLDVPHLLTLDRDGILATWKSFYAMMRAIAASPIPVAAAITGHAPAGGAVISILCDHRVMAGGDWKIGLNEVHVGIPLPPVILIALQRLVGFREAERLVVSGVLVSASEALEIGLVDDLAPGGEVVQAALEHCQALLKLPPQAMAETRRRARADLHRAFEAAGAEEIEGVLDGWFSDETQAALRAVAERLAKKKG